MNNNNETESQFKMIMRYNRNVYLKHSDVHIFP